MKTFLLWLMPLLTCLPCLAADSVPGLAPVYLTTNNSVFRLTTLLEEDNPTPQLAFRAICTNEWLPGLVPVFAIQNQERFELRRRPIKGQENSTEPLFFALPNPDEPGPAQIAGRWDCIAVRGDGAKEHLGWEIAPEGHLLAGRFDQNTDYRFAHLTGGTFQSNQLEIKVEYIADAYVLTGFWETNGLKGTWRRTDDSERGTWEATRREPPFKGTSKTLALYEWKNTEGKRRYAVEGEPLPKGWKRASQPLCRVWK